MSRKFDTLCFNCGQAGHRLANCPHPRMEYNIGAKHSADQDFIKKKLLEMGIEAKSVEGCTYQKEQEIKTLDFGKKKKK